MAQTGKKWYVLRAVSGKEGKVKEYLEALMKRDELLAANVGEILLPTEKYAQLRNGKRVVKEKLFLPGYVLVEANLQGEVAHTLRFMPNVLGFLGGLDNPTPVRQADINRILGTAEDITIKSEEVAIPFSIDEGIEPQYVELPGWNCDLSKCKSEADFPKEFKDYIAFLEKELETPITILSVGPDRDQTICR